jgi:hypothetical protein
MGLLLDLGRRPMEGCLLKCLSDRNIAQKEKIEYSIIIVFMLL